MQTTRAGWAIPIAFAILVSSCTGSRSIPRIPPQGESLWNNVTLLPQGPSTNNPAGTARLKGEILRTIASYVPDTVIVSESRTWDEHFTWSDSMTVDAVLNVFGLDADLRRELQHSADFLSTEIEIAHIPADENVSIENWVLELAETGIIQWDDEVEVDVVILSADTLNIVFDSQRELSAGLEVKLDSLVKVGPKDGVVFRDVSNRSAKRALQGRSGSPRVFARQTISYIPRKILRRRRSNPEVFSAAVTSSNNCRQCLGFNVRIGTAFPFGHRGAITAAFAYAEPSVAHPLLNSVQLKQVALGLGPVFGANVVGRRMNAVFIHPAAEVSLGRVTSYSGVRETNIGVSTGTDVDFTFGRFLVGARYRYGWWFDNDVVGDFRSPHQIGVRVGYSFMSS